MAMSFMTNLRNALTEQMQSINIFKHLRDLSMLYTEALNKLVELTEIAKQNQAANQVKDEQIASLTDQVNSMTIQLAQLNNALTNQELHPEVADQIATLESVMKGTSTTEQQAA